VIDSDVGRSTVLVDDVAVDRDPLLDIALGPALLQQVAAGGGPELLRIYRPRPTLAFSGRDCAAPGIAAAAAAARSAGFAPVRRGPGGRAAAYHRGALCLDHLGPSEPAANGIAWQGIRLRFAMYGELLAEVLRSVGVDAGVGPVPGEYCPGDFSVNDGHGHKLVGTAQRLVRGAWLFSVVIVVTDPDPIRDVLVEVYRELKLEWDPGTVGAVGSTASRVTVQDVKAALLRAYPRLGRLRPSPLAAGAVDLAEARRGRHLVPGG
jgi:lipoate-protein ligase A